MLRFGLLEYVKHFVCSAVIVECKASGSSRKTGDVGKLCVCGHTGVL